jgi:hypothetical protein
MQAASNGPDEQPPEHMQLYETRSSQEGYVCKTCGALVATMDPYPRAHWDWHEASNGA